MARALRIGLVLGTLVAASAFPCVSWAQATWDDDDDLPTLKDKSTTTAPKTGTKSKLRAETSGTLESRAPEGLKRLADRDRDGKLNPDELKLLEKYMETTRRAGESGGSSRAITSETLKGAGGAGKQDDLRRRDPMREITKDPGKYMRGTDLVRPGLRPGR